MYDEWLKALQFLAAEAKPKTKFAIALGIDANQAVIVAVIEKLMDLGYVALSDVDQYVITYDGLEKVKSLL